MPMRRATWPSAEHTPHREIDHRAMAYAMALCNAASTRPVGRWHVVSDRRDGV